MKTVFVIEPEDNVGTAVLETSIQGGDIVITTGSVTNLSVTANADIPYGHKIALRLIKKGEPVIKYGLNIGIATENIQPGDHVHLHNVKIKRGRGKQALAKI